MIVNIVDYGEADEKNFIAYEVSGLSADQIDYLHSNLTEEMSVNGDVLRITVQFESEFYPFQSETAKIRMDDFIAREEIEMNVFLSSVLEDM
jgi:hypothetical protein